MADIIDYYSRRSAEYEEIYAKPERQVDLARLTELLQEQVAGQSVLELAGTLSRRVGPDVTVLFFDNRFVEGSSTPIAFRDNNGNTYQRRALRDGTVFEIMKNFPTREDLLATAAPFGDAGRVVELEYYWLMTYRTAVTARSKPSH